MRYPYFRKLPLNRNNEYQRGVGGCRLGPPGHKRSGHPMCGGHGLSEWLKNGSVKVRHTG